MKAYRILTVLLAIISVSGCSAPPPTEQLTKGPCEPLTSVVVIDGDTIKTSERKIRFIGINTMELTTTNKTQKKWALIAKEELTHIIEQAPVCIVKDPQVADKDKYGRDLRYVYQGNTLLNESLVEKGLAEVYMIDTFTYKEGFLKKQAAAVEQGTGMWKDRKPRK